MSDFEWLLVCFFLFLIGVGVVAPLMLTQGWGMILSFIPLVCGGLVGYAIFSRQRKRTDRTRGRETLTSKEEQQQTEEEVQPAEEAPQPVKEVIREREVIREVIKIPCSHCGTLIPIEAVKCPNCGAPLRR